MGWFLCPTKRSRFHISHSFSSNIIVFIAHFNKNSIETILCFTTMVSMCLMFAGFETKGLTFQWNEFINDRLQWITDSSFLIALDVQWVNELRYVIFAIRFLRSFLSICLCDDNNYSNTCQCVPTQVLSLHCY